MLGFRDMTFCTSKCGNKECFRQITEEVLEAGKRWWNGSEDFPMYTADFKEHCGQWKKETSDEDEQ
jgi:hypothetical protein